MQLRHQPDYYFQSPIRLHFHRGVDGGFYFGLTLLPLMVWTEPDEGCISIGLWLGDDADD